MRMLYLANRRLGLALVCLAVFSLSAAGAVADEKCPVREATPHDNFLIREEMVPMRDGIGLYTVIIRPKHRDGHLPILLNRTPYDATGLIRGHASPRLDVMVDSEYLGEDYIYVKQDIRGRFKSEGEYSMYRAPRGQFNQTETDETTDAWDTIQWLVKNVPSNGRVGVWGTSYPGWLTLAAMRDPHPALAAAVPFNPVVDVWKADDWYHWGAFRAAYAFNFIYTMETRLDQFTPYPYENQDLYDWMLRLGAAGKGIGARLADRHKMWKRIIDNPQYGPYWRDVAADQWFDAPPRLVPALHVHGFWDQEDIYGAPAVYAAVERHDALNDTNYFVAGPWYHGQHFGNGSHIGDIQMDQDTAKRFREDVLRPFLRRYLHADEEDAIAQVNVFETGANRWRQYDQWPPAGESVGIYLQGGGGLKFGRPTEPTSPTSYDSDPAKPVPFVPRPNWPFNYENKPALDKWRRWMVEDQRFVAGRPDVATWVSEPLDKAMTIRGAVTATLFAETTGSDADWVVKLIDVYPDDAPGFVMSGYQLMVSGEIFRGRYRTDYEKATPVQANQVLEYTIPLPQVNHTFLPGHRIMIHVQSSWFPLYDLNPQTFVPSIMWADDTDYQAKTHRIHHSPEHPSSIQVQIQGSR